MSVTSVADILFSAYTITPGEVVPVSFERYRGSSMSLVCEEDPHTLRRVKGKTPWTDYTITTSSGLDTTDGNSFFRRSRTNSGSKTPKTPKTPLLNMMFCRDNRISDGPCENWYGVGPSHSKRKKHRMATVLAASFLSLCSTSRSNTSHDWLASAQHGIALPSKSPVRLRGGS
ncbi:hypothetical protein EJ08DRAFT_462718 [Tothia fuscella]|uniref:Uncharacterized protein n=1 Tax=Tothia fuscella TaxID=1048955 RepID=A0A9P4NIJ8_9PEZI|nr:hypothetical protein EJ08DRAFT_462718 [Tothia fuscella]